MVSVLYVDDEPDLLALGKLFLEQDGSFSVDILSSAREALLQLESKQYDAIISDFQMPGMTGIEFLQRVRASGNTIPFIIFTGRSREEIVIRALNEGADFYLQKGSEPVSQFAELANKVEKAVFQRRAEARIRDHERREADIINFLPDATFAIDTNGVVIAWNRAMERMTGVRSSEILGKGSYEYAIPFYHERRPILIDLVLNGDPSTAARYPYIKRNGKTLFSETMIPHFNDGRGAALWFTASPLYTTQGTIVGAIESIREITERKKAEAALVEKTQELDQFFETNLDLLCIADVHGYFRRLNHEWEKTLGYTLAELEGHTFLDFVHPDDLEATRAAVSDLDQNKEMLNFVNRFRCKDGSYRWIEWRSSSRGKVIYAAARDITERKLQEHISRVQLDLGLALQEKHGLYDTLTICLDAAIGISGMDAGGIYLVDDMSGSLDLMVSQNVSEEFKKSVSRYPPASLNARTVMEGKPIYVQFSKTGIIHPPVQESEGLKAAAIIPISYNGRSIACLITTSHSADEIPANARLGLETIAVQIGAAIGRLRADEALHKSEEKYRNVVEDQTEFISRFLPDGTHVFVNEAYCRYFGLNRGEILGHRFRPETPSDDAESLKRFFSSLTPDHPVDSIEHRIIMPDGSVRWQRWSDRGIFDPAGTLIEYQSVGRDITRQKRSEEELRAVQEKYAKAFLAVPDAITISDLDSGQFIEVNDAATALFGYSRDELIGKSASELGIWLKEEDRASFIDQLMKHGRVHGYEVVERRKSGELYDALVNADTLTIGGRQYFIAIVRDITERKRTERAIAETTKKIEILTSITRHDVANQVSILRGFARLALKGKPDPVIADFLSKIDTAGSTIARQIAFTRTYQELGIHAPGWYRIREIVTQQKPEGLALSCTCDAEIFADPMIERVFFNLFENAVRHGDRVTGVAVRCRADNGCLIITFEDDGVGIPADQKAAIFEKGYGRNTGFGLFLGREILAITGIAIHEAGTPGMGARFEIAVPVGKYQFAEGPVI
jgi:PAS domain S-box-containing protein